MPDAAPTRSETSLSLRFLHRVLPVAMLVILLVGIGGSIRLVFSLGQPYPGFALVPRKEIKLFSVIWTTPPHWPGIEAGMRTNDKILCIDGYYAGEYEDGLALDPSHQFVSCPKGVKSYADVFREAYDRPDRMVSILIDRGGIQQIDGVPILRFDFVSLLEIYLPLFLLGLGFLSLGYTVYRAGPDQELNLVFALFTTVIAGFSMDWTYVPRISPWFQDALAITLLINVPWFPFLGAILLHLTSLLTEPGFFQQIARKVRMPHYIITLLFSFLGVVVYLFEDQPIDLQCTPVFYGYIMVSAVLSVAWSLVSLVWTYRHSSSRRIRHQSALVLLALLILLAVMVPLMFLFTGASVPRYLHTAPFFAFTVVAVFAYAILRYQLFASKAAILKALVVASYAVLITSVVYLLIGRSMGFLPILAASLLTSIGLAVRWGPSSAFTRLLRREILDYQTIARFSQRVGALRSMPSILEAAQRSFQQDVDTEEVRVWLLAKGGADLDGVGTSWRPGSTLLPANLAEHLTSHPEPVRIAEDSVYRGILAPFEPDPSGLWIPLVDRGNPVGLLYLGPRWTGEDYDDEDLVLIRMMARQLALAILNTRQLDRLQATSLLVLKAQENERIGIARELHDTIVHFLLVLTYGLDGLKEDAKNIAPEIERWQDRISIESGRLRDLLTYLRAPELLVQNGLVSSLQECAHQASADAGIRVETDLASDAEAALGVDAQLALYRVCREAIHNALKHASASRVAVRLWREDNRVHFAVEDDGQGFDIADALATKGGGYSSLLDMRAYVEAIGGAMQLRSAPGLGTAVSGTVPAAKDG